MYNNETEKTEELKCLELKLQSFNDELTNLREKIYSTNGLLYKQELQLVEEFKRLNDFSDTIDNANEKTHLWLINEIPIEEWNNSIKELKDTSCKSTKLIVEYCKETDRFKILSQNILNDYITIQNRTEEFRSINIERLCQNAEIDNRFDCFDETLYEIREKYNVFMSTGIEYLKEHKVFMLEWISVTDKIKIFSDKLREIDESMGK